MKRVENPKVFVARRIPAAAADRLGQRCEPLYWPDRLPPPREELINAVEGCDGILSLLTDPIDGELMDAAGPQLSVVSNFAIGVDNIDVAEASRRGILVCNTPGVLTDTTADLAFALILSAARRVPEGIDAVREGEWLTWEPEFMLGVDVYGATLGIVGLGRIGQAVARRARGFGMTILALTRTPNPELCKDLGVELVSSLEELLERSDFVSLHAPLTEQTRGLIDAAALRRMKSTAILVNTARGPLVNQDDLVRALESNEIRFAALDVTVPEPLPTDHPLAHMTNCLVLPHVGSATEATRGKMGMMAVVNLIAALDGERPPHMVNPEVFEGW